MGLNSRLSIVPLVSATKKICLTLKVDIYFTAIGLFDVPTEQELLKTAEEIKNRKQLTDKSA